MHSIYKLMEEIEQSFSGLKAKNLKLSEEIKVKENCADGVVPGVKKYIGCVGQQQG